MDIELRRQKRREWYARTCGASHKKYYEANKARVKAWCDARYADGGREKLTAEYRARVYGVLPQDMEEMIEAQAGLCAICCEPMNPYKGTHVDHNHETGRVRGLLCARCNTALGLMRDEVTIADSAADYLRQAG